MLLARYGGPEGPLLKPLAFWECAGPDHRRAGPWPFCDGCHEIVHVHALRSLKVEACYRHSPLAVGADPLDDCVLAERSVRFLGLKPAGYDEARGAIVRAEFFEDRNLAVAYRFCLNLCRDLPFDAFRALIARADRHRIWSYIGIEQWAIPYLLITLGSYEGLDRTGRPYGFHFVLHKRRRTGVSDLWEDPLSCALVKVFSGTGERVRTNDNPFPLSARDLAEKAGNVSRVTPGLLRLLRA